MSFLDKISMQTLVIAAIFLGLSPFVPEPHLWQKLKMLVAGDLVKPLDMFDMLFHGAPTLLLIAKLARNRSRTEKE